MIRKLLFAVLAASSLLLAPATAASASAVTPGAFCADADHGAIRQATNHHWYICGQDPSFRYRWLPTTGPASPSTQPTATCTHDGYGKTCASQPAPSRSGGYGHPMPSKSPQQTLPVTSSTSGKLLAGLIVGGVLLVLIGTGLYQWKPIRRRRARHAIPAQGASKA